MISNQPVVQQENSEPSLITKAKDFIQQNQAEEALIRTHRGQLIRAHFILQDVQKGDRPALHR
jgi:hypothetical protein